MSKGAGIGAAIAALAVIAGTVALGPPGAAVAAGIVGAGAAAGESAQALKEGNVPFGESTPSAKPIKRATTMPKFPTDDREAIRNAPTDPDAAKRALDAADQERRRKLVSNTEITGSLGLSEQANVRRSVLG